MKHIILLALISLTITFTACTENHEEPTITEQTTTSEPTTSPPSLTTTVPTTTTPKSTTTATTTESLVNCPLLPRIALKA